MSDLEYPLNFKCSGCGEKTTVTREDARALYSDPDSTNAPIVVLEDRGWVRRSDGLFCPECAAASGMGR